MNKSQLKDTLQKGDIIVMGWDFFPIEHYGFYDGSGIYENRMGVGVGYLPLDEFLKRYDYWKVKDVFRASDSATEIDKMIQKAKSRLGEKYNAFKFNCEHYIDYILGHPLKSESLGRLGNLTSGILLGTGLTILGIYIYKKIK